MTGTTEELGSFTVRQDQRGLRFVFNLGNEGGDCPNRCKFCDVGRSPRVTPAENRHRIDAHLEEMEQLPALPVHPLIYNQGSVTNPAEFSPVNMDYLLDSLAENTNICFVSVNSRERYTNNSFLQHLVDKQLPYPVHFIFGVESFSPNAPEILGKDTRGELNRFISKLSTHNQLEEQEMRTGGYRFGLDVSLVLLPELHLEQNENRHGNQARIIKGFCYEIETLLSLMVPTVPLEINLHPYKSVDALPYRDLPIQLCMETLPVLQEIVNRHNATHPDMETHLFVGIEGAGYDDEARRTQVGQYKAAIERFNETGICSWREGPSPHPDM